MLFCSGIQASHLIIPNLDIADYIVAFVILVAISTTAYSSEPTSMLSMPIVVKRLQSSKKGDIETILLLNELDKNDLQSMRSKSSTALSMLTCPAFMAS